MHWTYINRYSSRMFIVNTKSKGIDVREWASIPFSHAVLRLLPLPLPFIIMISLMLQTLPCSARENAPLVSLSFSFSIWKVLWFLTRIFELRGIIQLWFLDSARGILTLLPFSFSSTQFDFGTRVFERYRWQSCLSNLFRWDSGSVQRMRSSWITTWRGRSTAGDRTLRWFLRLMSASASRGICQVDHFTQINHFRLRFWMWVLLQKTEFYHLGFLQFVEL